MSTVAYELRAEYAGDVELDGETVPRYLGGVVSIDDTREVNVREELDAGNGRIVVADNDVPALNALDNYPPLKRVSAEGSERLTVDQYADANVPALDAELKLRGITGLNATKADKVAALHIDDARLEAGIPQPDDYSVAALVAGAVGTPDDDSTPEA